MKAFPTFLKSVWSPSSLFDVYGGIMALIVYSHPESQRIFFSNYYSHSRPVSWCLLGIFWGLPAGGPGRRAGGRASSHRCRRTRNRPLSSPPSPSHLPSACTGARCQGDRRRQAGRQYQSDASVFDVVCEKQIHVFIKKHPDARLLLWFVVGWRRTTTTSANRLTSESFVWGIKHLLCTGSKTFYCYQ